MTPAFWSGRSVLVTGHTGFKGSWLALWLRQAGARVAGLALDPPTRPSLFETAGLGGEFAADRGDVRDLARVREAFERSGPEVVIHMAAQSLVRPSYAQPVDTFTTNVVGTVHCLEAARESRSVRAVLVVTTDKCYRNRGGAAPYREGDELGGEDPYSASKAAAEIATHAYRQSFFGGAGAPLVASVRAGNVIGGGDWAADRLVPDAMRSFAAGQPLRVRNPAATRPWQHVLDPLHGYLVVAERLHGGDRSVARAWNFGPDAQKAQPVSWIAQELAARWGDGARWEATPSAGPGEAAELALDSAQAQRLLGWRPLLALPAALDWVVEWYRAFERGARARALTLEQIGRFQALAAR